MRMSSVRLYCVLTSLLLVAPPAFAQFQPRSVYDPPTGEGFRIEGFAGFWTPAAEGTASVQKVDRK